MIILSDSRQIRLSIEKADASGIYGLLREFFKEHKMEPGKWESITDNLKIVIIDASGSKNNMPQQDAANGQDYKLFQKFNGMLERELARMHKVNDYCVKIGVTPRKLSAICLRYSHKTAKELICERLVAEAKQLLQYTSFSIKEIASLLGFSDQYQFSKYFKKHMKISPAHYRNRST